jgi:hypothetical protein
MVSPLVVLITMMFMAILDISAVNVAIPPPFRTSSGRPLVTSNG